MSDCYPTPIHFVTVMDQPASQAVMNLLPDCLHQLKRDINDTHRCLTLGDGNHLLDAYGVTINTKLTVALFDVRNGVKTFKPLHLTQPDPQRPLWANSPQWAIKINTRHATNKKVIRNCAQQIAAWFRRGIETAVPNQTYPWGTAPAHERQMRILAIADELASQTT